MAAGRLTMLLGPSLARTSSVGIVRAVTVVLVLAAYEALSRSGLVFTGALPSLLSIAGSLARTLGDPGFYPHLLRTAYEAGGGVIIGGTLGVICGVAFGTSPFTAALLDPWVRALAPAPKIVFIPIMMLAFGIDAGPKLAMASISAFFPVVVATYGGMRQVRPILVRVVRSFGASVPQTVRLVYLPSIAGPLLGSLRLAVGVALIGALLAEVKLSNMGLGYLIIQHFNAFRTADMYALLLIVFMLALILNSGLRAVSRRFGAA